jgi:hypothetical protein
MIGFIAMYMSNFYQTKIKTLFNVLSRTAKFSASGGCVVSEMVCPQPNFLVNNAG